MRAPTTGAEVETVIDPSRPIIDPHHHLWDRPGRRFLAEEFLADLEGGHNIRATVYIDCRSNYRTDGPALLFPVGEADFVAAQAAAARDLCGGRIDVCAAMSGRADLTAGEAIDDLLIALDAASGGRLRGIRNIVAWDQDFVAGVTRARPHLMLDPDFRAGVARLGRNGVLFEAWLYHPQLPELVDLADAVPETTIVLNHVGGPLGAGSFAGRREEIFSVWSRDIRDLATRQNVCVKLGGLGMPLCGFGFEAQPGGVSSLEAAAAWRPYIETCIEAFGPDRCMFESNVPPDLASISYLGLWNAFKRIAADYSESEKHKLFYATAARIYRLPRRETDCS